MPPEKTITLKSISDERTIRSLLESTLYDLLGIKGRLRIGELEKLGQAPEGTLRGYISSLAREISKRVMGFEENLKQDMRSFSSTTTKLGKDIIEKIWKGVSLFLEKSIENSDTSETNEIPELRKLITETPLVFAAGSPYGKGGREEKEFLRKQKERIIENLDSLNDRNVFMLKFRNNFFEYFKKEYGLVPEPAQELIDGGPKMH